VWCRVGGGGGGGGGGVLLIVDGTAPQACDTSWLTHS